MRTLEWFGRPALPFAVLLMGWWGLSRSGLVTSYTVPAPEQVLQLGLRSLADRSILVNILASLGRLGMGLLVGFSTGVLVGMLLGINRRLAEFFLPLMTFLTSLSGIAWMPLAIVWFGLGWKAVVFIMVNQVMFVLAYNVLHGVRATPRIFEQAVLTLGGGRWQVITQVLVPGALPSLVTGLRQGLGFGWRAVIAAEMFGTTTGLGFMIFNAANFLDSASIVLGIIIIGTFAVVVDRLLLLPLENHTVRRWGMYR